MRVDRDQEMIFFKDREDLARMVGTLLGCHDYHVYTVDTSRRSLVLPVRDLSCVSDAMIPYRLTLDKERVTHASTMPW